MKRSTRSVTAFVLTLLLIIASPVAAFAGEIQGTSTVEDLVINVVLPSTIDFVLDPLGLDENNDNQIASADYFFVNQTLAPVRVQLEVTATATNDAALVSSSSAIEGRDDPDVTDKLIYFGALGASDISTTVTTTDTAVFTTSAATSYEAYFGGDSAPTGVYTSGAAMNDTLVPVVPETGGTTGSAVIGFALGAALDTTTPGSVEALATNNDGVAAFQFYAELNTYAPWQDGDLAVTGNYTLVPLRTATYDTYHAAEVGLNQYIVEESDPEVPAPTYDAAGFIIGEDTFTTHDAITVSKASADDVTIPFYFDGKTIASLVMNGTYTAPASEYSISGNNLVLPKEGDGTTYLLDRSSVAVKNFTLTLSGSAISYTFSINLTN